MRVVEMGALFPRSTLGAVHRSFPKPDANNRRHLRLVFDKLRAVKTNDVFFRGGRKVAGPRAGEIYLHPKQRSPLRGELSWETRTAEGRKAGRKEGRKVEERKKKGRVRCERQAQPQKCSLYFSTPYNRDYPLCSLSRILKYHVLVLPLATFWSINEELFVVCCYCCTFRKSAWNFCTKVLKKYGIYSRRSNNLSWYWDHVSDSSLIPWVFSVEYCTVL